MDSVKELLRDADPLRHEPSQSVERDRVRAVVMSHTSGWTNRGTVGRRVALAAGGAALVGLAVTSSRIWSSATLHAAAVRFEARLAEKTPTLDLQPVRIAGSNETIYLYRDPIVTNDDVLGARVVPTTDPSRFDVGIGFTPEGAERMRAATAGHIGRPLALMIDGEIVMAPTVRAVVSTDALLTGNYTRSEADRIANGVMLR